MVNLDLLRTVTIPAPTLAWAKRCIFDAALTRTLAFPAAPNAVHVGKIGMQFAVPSDATMIAPNLKRRCLASLNSQGGLQLRDDRGVISRQRDFGREAGQPRALAFSADGGVLFVSFELSLQNRAVPQRIVAVDAATLDEIASATINGDIDASHFISVHPNEPVIAFHVICGQDGVWTNIFRLESRHLNLWTSIRPDDDNAPLIAFAPNGSCFVGKFESTLQAWEWPSLKLVAEADVDDEEGEAKYFTSSIGFWNDRLMVIADEPDGMPQLQLRSLPNLRIASSVPLALPEHVRHVEVIGEGLLFSSHVTNKKRISPADCKPESETFQLWRVA